MTMAPDEAPQLHEIGPAKPVSFRAAFCSPSAVVEALGSEHAESMNSTGISTHEMVLVVTVPPWLLVSGSASRPADVRRPRGLLRERDRRPRSSHRAIRAALPGRRPHGMLRAGRHHDRRGWGSR